jgi:hypothetical protein
VTKNLTIDLFENKGNIQQHGEWRPEMQSKIYLGVNKYSIDWSELMFSGLAEEVTSVVRHGFR